MRVAVPSIVSYSLDHGSYDGISIELLRKNYEPTLPPDLTVSGQGESFCVKASFNGIVVSKSVSKSGFESPIRVGPCS